MGEEIKDKDIVYWQGIQGVVFEIAKTSSGLLYSVALNEQVKIDTGLRITYGARWIQCGRNCLKTHFEEF